MSFFFVSISFSSAQWVRTIYIVLVVFNVTGEKIDCILAFRSMKLKEVFGPCIDAHKAPGVSTNKESV